MSAGLSVLWPGLMPTTPKGAGSIAISRWYHLSLSDSTLFSAFLFGATAHWRLQSLTKGRIGDNFRPRDKEMLLVSELEAIKGVNKAIEDPSQPLGDGVILSVICLANNGHEELLQDMDPRLPFRSPLRDLQWLDIYGSILPNRIHLAGLAQLLKIRKGPQKTKLPGLAPIIT
jgi:hypothetical protein